MFSKLSFTATLLLPLSSLAHDLKLKSRASRTSSALATVYTTCKTPGEVAITFDDGPYIYESQIIQTLARYKAKATFFINGNNWDCIYSQATSVAAAYAAGHDIGSHTWSHPDLTTLNATAANTEITKLTTAIKKITGAVPALFRPPYGSYNDQVLQIIKQNGMSAILWDFDSGDSTGSTVAQSESTYQTKAQSFPASFLALNHETEQSTATTLLPNALQLLKNKGYKLVTVSQCLGIKPYQSTGKASKKDSTWTC